MPKVAEWLINGVGWRGAFIALGVFAIVGGGLAALFVDGSPQRHGLLPDGGVALDAVPCPALEGMSLRETLRTRAFRLLFAACFFISIGLFIPFVHLVPYAQDQGIPYATAVTLFTLVGVGSTLGRFCLGGIADRLGRRRSLGGMYFGVAVMMGLWYTADEVWEVAAFALIYGTFYGGFVALAPALLVDYFGPRTRAASSAWPIPGLRSAPSSARPSPATPSTTPTPTRRRSRRARFSRSSPRRWSGWRRSRGDAARRLKVIPRYCGVRFLSTMSPRSTNFCARFPVSTSVV